MAAFGRGLATTALAAPADDDKAQTIVHLLDYVGVDYPDFVRDGKVLDEAEYAEQREFVGQAIALLGQLPVTPEQPALLEQARILSARIEAKAPGDEVAKRAADLRAGTIRSWRLRVAPRQPPDPVRGATLFATQCATCHGAAGHGDGPLAKGMDPAPSDFHDDGRMQQRSLYGLYNTITLGVGGTTMRAFTELSEADRWALAFHVGGLRATPRALSAGEAAWQAREGREVFSSLQVLATLTPQEQLALARGASERQPGNLDAIRAWLTHHPQAVQGAGLAPLALARSRLEEAVAAYRAGNREGAQQLAIAAYLEGFERVEVALDNVAAPLRIETERQMMALRALIAGARPADAVAEQAARIATLLDEAEEKLSGGTLSPATAFFSSLLILLREGLEAILVLAAIIAFVRKTGRRDALPWIHAGWLGAVALGALTWIVARELIDISGAGREMTEGITALAASAMLLYVGWWLHSRSNARAWTTFIRDQVGSALGKRTLWALAGVSFLAVYRELFEIILFYETLFAQVGDSGRTAVLGGIGVAAALLAIGGAAILRYSVKLPIGPFFAATSALLALLAVVFAGHGVAALQEAGAIAATWVEFVTVPLLGIHPTVEGLGVQLIVLLLVVGGLWFNRTRVATEARTASAGGA